MPEEPISVPRDVFVALVGSKPLVVYVENWVAGRVEFVTYDGETVTYEGEPVTVVV